MAVLTALHMPYRHNGRRVRGRVIYCPSQSISESEGGTTEITLGQQEHRHLIATAANMKEGMSLRPPPGTPPLRQAL